MSIAPIAPLNTESFVKPTSTVDSFSVTPFSGGGSNTSMLDNLMSKAAEAGKAYNEREQKISGLGFESTKDLIERSKLLSERSVDLNMTRSAFSILRTGITDTLKQQ